MSVVLIARKNFWYAGLIVKRGQPFRASEQDAALLKLTKHADDGALESMAPLELPKPKRAYRRKTVTPTDSSDLSPKPTRTYRRRDLKPEE